MVADQRVWPRQRLPAASLGEHADRETRPQTPIGGGAGAAPASPEAFAASPLT